jgi:hypothetical protein
LHEGNVDVDNIDLIEMEVPYEPLPEMEISEPDPTFFNSQDNDENDTLEYRGSSCQEHDKDSGEDDYGKEEERPTLEEMLSAPEMLHSIKNFYMGPEPHQWRSLQLDDGGDLYIPILGNVRGVRASAMLRTKVREGPHEAEEQVGVDPNIRELLGGDGFVLGGVGFKFGRRGVGLR